MSERIIELLDKEIEKIGSKGELTTQSLENIHKLSESKYYLVAASAMEEGGEYSETYMYDDGQGYSGRRYRKRDSMGRYTRDSERGGSYDNGGRYSSRRGGYYNDNYSGRDGDMASMLEDMMDKTNDPKERETIQKMMSQFGR